MKNRREFVLTLTAGLVALAVIITPVIADELLGVITKIDVASKKLTVVEQNSDKEVVVTTDAETVYGRIGGEGTLPVDLEKLQSGVAKYQDAGKKGMPAKITHKDGVASKILVAGKKKAAP